MFSFGKTFVSDEVPVTTRLDAAVSMSPITTGCNAVNVLGTAVAGRSAAIVGGSLLLVTVS
jgi:hypothetical protein